MLKLPKPLFVQFTRVSALAIALCALLFGATAHAAQSPVDFADPMIGTDAHGHTYPGATLPFGMVQLSPDTRTDGWDACGGYHYDDTTIEGFSHTHVSGTGCGALGDILVMPTVGDVHWDSGQPGTGYCSRFSHSQEVAHPGYYRVFLTDPKVTAELTATAHCGFHRYTFPASDAAHLIVDLDHNIQNGTRDSEINVENNTTLSGFRQSDGWGGRRIVYYVMQFSRPFDSIIVQKNGQTADGQGDVTGGKVKACVTYKTAADEAILVKVGLSPTSVDEARKNLAAEIPAWNFDETHAMATAQWAKALGTVDIDTYDPHVKRTFYTAMYHSFVAPSLYNDADGTYRGFDHQIHTGAKFQNYSTFSIWDIYRAEAPLLTLLQPGRIDDIDQSFMAEYRESGQHTTPIWPLWDNETWCMVGYHSVDILADDYLKGFRSVDPETEYQAIRDTAMQDRNGLDSYKKLGYIASSPGAQATSKTIECSFDDWCIARMAAALGHADDARLFYQRSQNYRNLFDGTVGFFRGREANGSWRPGFVANGLVGDEYTEADAWQYAFDPQQDMPSLIKLYGGDTAFVNKMDAMFSASSVIHTNIPDISGRIGQYSQGDEQSHHVAYLYDYAGAPYKTQQHIREVMRTLYLDTPSGQCGNDDCGQMSAWYVFSALGFYPVNPDSLTYMIGSPTVTKAVIKFDQAKYHGTTFTVIADHNSAANIYIQRASLNGKPLNRAYLTHAELTSGGVLRLEMGPNPNKTWGQSIKDRPAATMPAGFKYAALPTPSEDKPLKLTVPIHVICGSDFPAGNFVPDTNMTDGDTAVSQAAIDTGVPHAAPAAVYQSERYSSDFTYSFPVPSGKSYDVRLHFAELFDADPGMRFENVQINGKTVLSNFEIIKAAGGLNKALVEDFAGIAPDRSGQIKIRISAVPSSPDQNAKISGIEILPEGGGD